MGIYDIFFIVNPTVLIVLGAFVIALSSVWMTKKFTDQASIRHLRAELKTIQKQTRSADVQKKSELTQKMMKINGRLMKHTMNPKLMIFNFIPAIIVFGILAAVVAFNPIAPGSTFTLSAKMDSPTNVSINVTDGLVLVGSTNQFGDIVGWNITALREGTYPIQISSGGQIMKADVIVNSKRIPVKPSVDTSGLFKEVKIGYPSFKPLGTFAIFGYEPGWLFTYIVLSIIFSMSLRKIMGVQ